MSITSDILTHISLAIAKSCPDSDIEIDPPPKSKKQMFLEAADAANFPRLRELIDDGLSLDREMNKRLTRCLTLVGSDWDQIKLFKFRRPKPYTLEAFDGLDFRSLSSFDLKRKFFSKPIALINISTRDHQPGSPYYGALSKCLFDISKLINKKIYKSFNVLRVLVDDKNELITIVKRVKNIFPNQPILHWMLLGHGNDMAIGMEKGHFTFDDNAIMESVSQDLDPRATLALGGCCNASGESRNLTKTFSLHSGNRMVFGCKEDVGYLGQKILKVGYPVLVPTFTIGGDEYSVRGYLNGEEILDVSLTARSRL